jgi:hypothetical protein
VRQLAAALQGASKLAHSKDGFAPQYQFYCYMPLEEDLSNRKRCGGMSCIALKKYGSNWKF